MHERPLTLDARLHALGALTVVALAGLTWLLVVESDLAHPGTRVCVLLGGLVVTAVLLMRDLHDSWPIAYTLAFVGTLGVFAAVSS